MKNNATIAGRFALIVVSAVMVSCGQKSAEKVPDPVVPQAETVAPAVDDYGIPENPTWARALVASDQVADLVAYEQKFKDVLGDTDLEKHLIRCASGCAELSATPAPKRLVYYFAREHQNIFGIFGEAWEATLTGAADAGFNLTFDGQVPPGVCNDPPHPAPCQFMPPCPDMCGRRSGGCPAC